MVLRTKSCGFVKIVTSSKIEWNVVGAGTGLFTFDRNEAQIDRRRVTQRQE